MQTAMTGDAVRIRLRFLENVRSINLIVIVFFYIQALLYSNAIFTKLEVIRTLKKIAQEKKKFREWGAEKPGRKSKYEDPPIDDKKVDAREYKLHLPDRNIWVCKS